MGSSTSRAIRRRRPATRTVWRPRCAFQAIDYLPSVQPKTNTSVFGEAPAAVGLSAEDRPSRTPRSYGHGPDESRCSGQGDGRPSTCATRTRRGRRVRPPLEERGSAGLSAAGGVGGGDLGGGGAPPRKTTKPRGPI